MKSYLKEVASRFKEKVFWYPEQTLLDLIDLDMFTSIKVNGKEVKGKSLPKERIELLSFETKNGLGTILSNSGEEEYLSLSVDNVVRDGKLLNLMGEIIVLDTVLDLELGSSVLDSRVEISEVKDGVCYDGLVNQYSGDKRNFLVSLFQAQLADEGYLSPSTKEYTVKELFKAVEGYWVDHLLYLDGSETCKAIVDIHWDGIGYCFAVYKDGEILPYNWDSGTLVKDKVRKLFD